MQRIHLVFHQLETLSTPPVLSLVRLKYVPSRSVVVGFKFTFPQDPMFDKQDYVNLGRLCAGVCEALERGSKGRRLDELSPSTLGTIEQLTT